MFLDRLFLDPVLDLELVFDHLLLGQESFQEMFLDRLFLNPCPHPIPFSTAFHRRSGASSGR
jgi:hypothetical protein